MQFLLFCHLQSECEQDFIFSCARLTIVRDFFCLLFFSYLTHCANGFMHIAFQGLISGSAELREQAAQGLGELIEVTSEQALKEFIVPITGYALWSLILVKIFSIVDGSS